MTRKEFFPKNEFGNSSPWTAQDLINAFYSAQQKGEKSGLTGYENLPTSIDCTSWFPFFNILSGITDETGNEAAIIASATPDGFQQRHLFGNHNDHDVKLPSSNQLHPSDSVLLHTHPSKFPTVPSVRERDARRLPMLEDHLSSLDTVKLLINKNRFITIGAIHGSSVVLLFRSNETPTHWVYNPITICYFFYSYALDFSVVPLYIMEELYGNSQDYPITNRVLLQHARRFAQKTHSGLYQISNHRYNQVAQRIG